MDSSLQRQLDQVKFEMRLRPHPGLLAQKQKILAEMDSLEAIHTEVLEHSALRAPRPPFVQAFPTGEESFRCPNCNRLYAHRYKALCPDCWSALK